MHRLTITLVASLLALSACDTPTAPPPEQPAVEQPAVETPVETPAAAVDLEKATKAATIARAIRDNPAGAEALLQEHGMSEADFEAMMYDIAQDEGTAHKYAELLAQ